MTDEYSAGSVADIEVVEETDHPTQTENGIETDRSVTFTQEPARIERFTSYKDDFAPEAAWLDSNDNSNGFHTVTSHVRKAKIKNKKMKLFRDFLLFLMFVTMFLVVVFMMRRVTSSYFMKASLEDVFLFEEYAPEFTHVQKTFHDIGSMEELWQFLRGPLLSAISSLSLTEEVFILQYNRLLGSVRMRQLRVKDSSCDIPPPLNDLVSGGCFSTWTSGANQRAPFGPEGDPTKYKYEETGSPQVWGFDTTYTSGGYVVDLEYNPQVAEKQIAELESEAWLDEPTRALFITLNVFNPGLNLFMTILFTIEMHPTGSFQLSSAWRSFPADLYLTNTDYVRAFFECVFVICLIYQVFYLVFQMIKAARNPRRGILKWFVDPIWNSVSVVSCVLYLILCTWYCVFVSQLTSFTNNIVDLSQGRDFTIMEELGFSFSLIFGFASLNIFVSTLSVFKYFQLNERMQSMWITLKYAGPDLVAFGFFFFVLFLAFVGSGMLLFGPDVSGFRNFITAFITCFEMMLGEFAEYDEMVLSNRVLAPLFYMSFCILIFLILTNMFIAIVNDAYHKNREKLHKREVLTLAESAKKTAHKIWIKMKRMYGRWFMDGREVGKKLKDKSALRKKNKLMKHKVKKFLKLHPEAWDLLTEEEVRKTGLIPDNAFDDFYQHYLVKVMKKHAEDCEGGNFAMLFGAIARLERKLKRLPQYAALSDDEADSSDDPEGHKALIRALSNQLED